MAKNIHALVFLSLLLICSFANQAQCVERKPYMWRIIRCIHNRFMPMTQGCNMTISSEAEANDEKIDR
ncbi:hypothetical protein EJB05_51315 [Eragrostis curvula]|uniref:Uncharacterized protein n=1 Tax=Eragrostis curvula TaxID=38414 RepID=A0A5J9SW58_9POAL|nr:hypothetical protein EJB05_51315 [Eragrostis curvula]